MHACGSTIWEFGFEVAYVEGKHCFVASATAVLDPSRAVGTPKSRNMQRNPLAHGGSDFKNNHGRKGFFLLIHVE